MCYEVWERNAEIFSSQLQIILDYGILVFLDFFVIRSPSKSGQYLSILLFKVLSLFGFLIFLV